MCVCVCVVTEKVCVCMCVCMCVCTCTCVGTRGYECVYECVYLHLFLLLLLLLLLFPHSQIVLSSSHKFPFLLIACNLQGVLLSEWDGLRSSSAAPVVVLGATNRPMDLDKGIVCTVHCCDVMSYDRM